MRQDALRSPKEHRSGGTCPARNHSRKTQSMCEGNLRRNEKMLVAQPRRQTRLPDTQGSAGSGSARSHRLNLYLYPPDPRVQSRFAIFNPGTDSHLRQHTPFIHTPTNKPIPGEQIRRRILIYTHSIYLMENRRKLVGNSVLSFRSISIYLSDVVYPVVVDPAMLILFV